MGFEPGSLREREDLPTVEPPCCGEVDVLDTGVGEAQFGSYQPIGQALVGTNGDLPVEHQAEPFIAAEIVALRLVAQFAISCRHAGQAESEHLVEGNHPRQPKSQRRSRRDYSMFKVGLADNGISLKWSCGSTE